MRYSNPLRRLWSASLYSLAGLRYALKHEQAFQYEAAVLAAVIVVAVCAGVPVITGTLLVGLWLCVMALELVNSAVELAFNLIDTKNNPWIKAGKDMLSATVFLMVSFNLLVWLALICGELRY